MRFSFTKIVVGIVVLVAIGAGIFVLVGKNNGDKNTEKLAPTVLVGNPNGAISNQKIIGKSVEGRDIPSYTYGSGETQIVFVGGIHGGYEWNSVLLAYQFMDYLKASPSVIPASISVIVIPNANPDGVFKVIGKAGHFSIADVPTTTLEVGTGRFNAHDVDLNRNFDCKWKPESTWRSKVVSAGTAAFSEPEALAIRNFALSNTPDAFVFLHSQANAVYASECEAGILPKTLDIMNAYSKAAGYQAVKSFDSYAISGDAEGWLASIGIPAITVELKTHETIEWEQNLLGIKALFEYYSQETGVLR